MKLYGGIDVHSTGSMKDYQWLIELEGGETQYFTHNLNDWKFGK